MALFGNSSQIANNKFSTHFYNMIILKRSQACDTALIVPFWTLSIFMVPVIAMVYKYLKNLKLQNGPDLFFVINYL